MHGPIVMAPDPADDIGHARIGIEERGLDLECSLLIHPVAMNDVGDFETSEADLADALNLVIDGIVFEIWLGPNVREHAVSLALPNIEGFSVPGIDEPVDVSFEPACYLGWKRLIL